jgi:hypothetical protein
MFFLRYLYYRIYKALERKGTLVPDFGAFIYIVTFLLLIASVINYVIEYVTKYSELIFRIQFLFNPVASQLLFFAVVVVFTYYMFTKKDINYYENLFNTKKWLNSHIKLWMILVLPCLLYILGIYFTMIY